MYCLVSSHNVSQRTLYSTLKMYTLLALKGGMFLKIKIRSGFTPSLFFFKNLLTITCVVCWILLCGKIQKNSMFFSSY
jgi:hypothetical protein